VWQSYFASICWQYILGFVANSILSQFIYILYG
jgi:hypothetical protein